MNYLNLKKWIFNKKIEALKKKIRIKHCEREILTFNTTNIEEIKKKLIKSLHAMKC